MCTRSSIVYRNSGCEKVYSKFFTRDCTRTDSPTKASQTLRFRSKNTKAFHRAAFLTLTLKPLQ